MDSEKLSLLLELKAHAKLDLPLAEEKSIGEIAGRAKRWVESCKYAGAKGTRAGCSGAGAKHIHSAIRTRNLSAVEDVEAFSQHLEFGILFYRKTARDAQIDVLGWWHVETVVRQQRETERAV